MAVVAEVETALRPRDVKLTRLRDELDWVWGWIVLPRRELHPTRNCVFWGRTMTGPAGGRGNGPG